MKCTCGKVTGPVWTEEQCRYCWRKRYPGDSPRIACVHRGERLGTIDLPVCTSGRTAPVPIYSCQIHGQCIRYGTCDAVMMEFVAARKRGDSPELWQCNLCKERQATDP